MAPGGSGYEWERASSEQRLDDGVVEREFTLGGIPGIGYSGGVIAIGIRLAVVEPRISAAGFLAGSFAPAAMFEPGT